MSLSADLGAVDGSRRERHTEEADKLYGEGWAHGTFGELLQGALPGEQAQFLITLPITIGARVTATLTPGAGELEITPSRKRKTLDLAHRMLGPRDPEMGGLIRVESELPEGKGFASSSADMVAAARAISDALGKPLCDDTLCRNLRQIEPTDGVMYPEFVAFLHRRVALSRRLGLPPRPLAVLCIDEGGQVDTIAFNQRKRGFSPAERRTYRALLNQATAAFETGDLLSIGDVATQSALLHQHRLPKRNLERFLRLKNDVGALGVAVTHSGPCIGLLFDSADADAILWTRHRLHAAGFAPARYQTLGRVREVIPGEIPRAE